MVRNYIRKTLDRWSREDLIKALTDLHSGKSLEEVLKTSNISRATLFRHRAFFFPAGPSALKKRGKKNAQPPPTKTMTPNAPLGTPVLISLTGKKRALLPEEEEKLVAKLSKMKEELSHGRIRKMAYEMCGDKTRLHPTCEINEEMGLDWFNGFRGRHPEISILPVSMRSVILSSKDEGELVEDLLIKEAGSVSALELRKMAFRFATDKSGLSSSAKANKMLGENWRQQFLKKHPEIIHILGTKKGKAVKAQKKKAAVKNGKVKAKPKAKTKTKKAQNKPVNPPSRRSHRRK